MFERKSPWEKSDLPKSPKSFRYKTQMYATRSVTKSIARSAGKIRLILRSQKLKKEKVPRTISLSKMEVIRKPDITKKISTPTYPPPKKPKKPAWNKTTGIMAIARKPSISGR